MSNCIHCGKPLENGQAMYMGKSHWECHEKHYGPLSKMTFRELISHTKRLAKKIEEDLK